MAQNIAIKKNITWSSLGKVKLSGKWGAAVALVPFILMVVMFQLLPLFTVVEGSFKEDGSAAYSFYNYIYIFKSRLFRQSIVNSLEISVYSTILGLLIALQGAYSMSKLKEGLRDKLLLLSNLTSNFSGLPLAFAFIVLLGSNGALTIILRNTGIIEGFDIYSKGGLVLLYTYFQIPLGILLMYPAFDAIKDEWYEAASLLGATKGYFWRKVALPVLLPSTLGTGIILFANSMGAYATAFGLMSSNYNIIPIRIGSLVAGDVFLKPNLAGALAVILTLILTLVICVNEVMIKRGGRNARK